ncbi:hypothetical protein B0H15DRAFT_842813 [Mycena belliarum]|uniref:Uncharacterized protein n=1 Tax=Mycena belliarum TaxID=1033014 RepID=A0AAD6U413_9AGAR|nr:hypothetical protein B0H15DRAFT_842813 [Mycena belliae]
MSLLGLPPELRAIIFDFCFPSPQTLVQIIPYQTSLPACRLNLPLAIYGVCRCITSELEPLPDKLRRLDFTYIIRGPLLSRGWRPEYGSKHDDDYAHFPFIMRFAQRVRLVGAGPIVSHGRTLSSAMRILVPGPECALRILEVQPRAWRKWDVARIMLEHLGALTTHPDVAARLEVRLIRATEDPLEDSEVVKTRLRDFQAGREDSGPIWVNLAVLEKPEPAVVTNFRGIEAWLKRFQEVRGADVAQRAQKDGPLGGLDDSDDSE